MNQQQAEQLDQQRKTWNTYAGGWKKWDQFLTKTMTPVSDKMIEILNLKGNKRVLDVASGTGEPGLTISKLLSDGNVNAIDLSPNMVAIANERAKASGMKNYVSQVGQSSEIPFDDNHFDYVICRYGAMFFPDVEGSLKEFLRVLKPGGKIVLAVWAAPEKNPFITLMGMTVVEKLGLPRPLPEAPGIFRFARPGILKDIMTGAGFNNVLERVVPGESVYDSPEHYWELTSDVAGPIMEALKSAPKHLVQDTKKAVLHKAANFIKDDKVYIPWEAIIVHGVKG